MSHDGTRIGSWISSRGRRRRSARPSTITDANALRMIVEAARRSRATQCWTSRAAAASSCAPSRPGQARDRHRHDAGHARPRAAAAAEKGVANVTGIRAMSVAAICGRCIRHRGDAVLHASFPRSGRRAARDGACLRAGGASSWWTCMHRRTRQGSRVEPAEKLRDPSHVRCLALDGAEALFDKADLPAPRQASTNCATKCGTCCAVSSQSGRRREDHRDVRRFRR